jgi:hypothetical protein
MILIIQIYNARDSRYKEMMTSLKNNIQNKFIDLIILLNEREMDLGDLNTCKIKQVIVNSRLTYAKAFEYCENNIAHGELIILANSDIWFDETLQKVNNYNMSQNVMALTRYDHKPDNSYILFESSKWAQDSWIFQNPIQLQYDCDFLLGIPGCDNRISWIIANSYKTTVGTPETVGTHEVTKYKLINPAKSINSFHEHLSGIRTYKKNTKRIPGPYLLIKAS